VPTSACSRPILALVAALAAVAALAGPVLAQSAVRVEVGESIQDAVDAHPAGTTFVLAAGVHREQQVVPRDGDRFIGEDGAVLSGARVLTGFVRTGSTWSVGGQTQEGLAHGTALPGHERDLHPEDLWIDGVRQRHVAGPDQLVEGTWWFDYGADRIHLPADPAGRLVETSTATFAFAGAGVRDVEISNLTITRYATPGQGGAIGGHYDTRDTRHWVVDRVTATENHAYGIIVAPGMVVTNSRAVANGQAGIGGSGTGQDGYVAPVVVRDSEIAHNLTLGYDWWWEGGGTKFSLMADMTFANNHVHHNGGPGVWFDVDNTGVRIVDNVVEHNDAQGIFYEISSGGHIEGNTVRGNSVVGSGGFFAAGIDISQSSHTAVVGNLVYDNPIGVLLRHDGNRADEGRVADVVISGNDITLPADGIIGLVVENADAATAQHVATSAGNRFKENTIRVESGAPVFAWGGGYWPRAAEWAFPDHVTTDLAHPETLPTHQPAAHYGAVQPGGPQPQEPAAPATHHTRG
jgi:parallel beta-helix repeat protein